MYEECKVTELRVEQITVRTVETELTITDRKHDSSHDMTGAIFNNQGEQFLGQTSPFIS